jgi:hypothetical protein
MATSGTNNDSKRTTTTPILGRRIYIFAIAFLAVFVVCSAIVPVGKRSASSLALLSVNSPNGQTLEPDVVRHVINQSKTEWLTEDAIKKMAGLRASKEARPSQDLDPLELKRLAKSIKIMWAPDAKNSGGVFIAIEFVDGLGTQTERNIVNGFAANLAADFRCHTAVATKPDLIELENNYRLTIARLKGITNFRTMLIGAYFRKVHAAMEFDPELDKSDVHQASANMSTDGSLDPAAIENPAWSILNQRNSWLLAQQIDLANKQLTLQEQVLSAEIAEELKWISKQLQIEPENLESTRVPQTVSKTPAVESPTNTPDTEDLGLQQNQFFQASNRQEVESDEVKVTWLSANDHYQTQGVIAELDVRIESLEREKSEWVSRLIHNKTTLDASSDNIDVGVVQTASVSNYRGHGFRFSTWLTMLITAALFGSVLAWQSDAGVLGRTFSSAEEVSRELGLAVLGSIKQGPADDASENFRRMVIRRTVTVCEFTIVGFAALLLVVAIYHTSVASRAWGTPLQATWNMIRDLTT